MHGFGWEPTHTRGEHANSTQKGPRRDSNLLLWGDGANHHTTVQPYIISFWDKLRIFSFNFIQQPTEGTEASCRIWQGDKVWDFLNIIKLNKKVKQPYGSFFLSPQKMNITWAMQKCWYSQVFSSTAVESKGTVPLTACPTVNVWS